MLVDICRLHLGDLFASCRVKTPAADRKKFRPQTELNFVFMKADGSILERTGERVDYSQVFSTHCLPLIVELEELESHYLRAQAPKPTTKMHRKVELRMGLE